MKNKINNYEIKLDDIFSSKSNTLLLLNKILRKSKIEKIFNFTVEEWLQNRNMVLDKISEQFDSDIIVRSSAQDEDSFESSKAGIYESILNVNTKIKTKKVNNNYKKLYQQIYNAIPKTFFVNKDGLEECAVAMYLTAMGVRPACAPFDGDSLRGGMGVMK